MDTSRKLQLAQLDLLLELKEICEKNNINYFLIGGTLLGAVRHKGFIPWDDDIDVGMMRSDYEKFRKVCDSELSDDYKLYDWNIDKSSPLAFMKLKIKGTKLIEDIAINSQVNNEIFIDIFPYDMCPSGKLKKKIHATKILLYKKIMLIRCGYRMSENRKVLRKYLNKSLYKLLELMFARYSVDEIRKLYEKEEFRYNNDDTDCCVNLSGSYSYKTEMQNLEILKSFSELEFEKNKFSVPVLYDKYLRGVYGDYMELPPKAMQVPRHNIGVELGEYKIKNSVYKEES